MGRGEGEEKVGWMTLKSSEKERAKVRTSEKVELLPARHFDDFSRRGRRVGGKEGGWKGRGGFGWVVLGGVGVSGESGVFRVGFRGV